MRGPLGNRGPYSTDTYGGTCIPSANEQARAQLGHAWSIADETAHRAVRRLAARVPADERQQLVLLNASETPFAGLIEVEPYLDWMTWSPHWRVLDEQGQAVPYQSIEPEAQTARPPARLLLRLDAEPGQQRILRIDLTPGLPAAPAPGALRLQTACAVGRAGVAFDRGERLTFGALERRQPWLELSDDFSDTWSHDIDRFQGAVRETPAWEPPRLVDRGPLMASFVRAGRIGSSRLLAEWRVFAAEPFVELRLRVLWCEQRRLLKLVVPLTAAQGREDGIPGGALERPMDGRELPLRDRTRVQDAQGIYGIVAPDCFSLDGSPDRLRLTLLRSPLFVHHDPNPGDSPRARVTDQGEHEFRFRFFAGEDATSAMLDAHAWMLQRPPLCAEVTRGMTPRH